MPGLHQTITPTGKGYLVQDDFGDLWVINSPNMNYVVIRYLETTGKRIAHQDIRELTPKDAQTFQKAISAARRHYNTLIFAGGA